MHFSVELAFILADSSELLHKEILLNFIYLFRIYSSKYIHSHWIAFERPITKGDFQARLFFIFRLNKFFAI